jgi:hypothetical protein
MINNIVEKNIQIEFLDLQMIEIALYIVHVIRVLGLNAEL